MPAADQPSTTSTDAHAPASFLAAAAALTAIDDALRDARQESKNLPDTPGPGPEQALASQRIASQRAQGLQG